MKGANQLSLCDRLGDKPLLIAHRGHRACYPENTCCAFAASVGRCGMIELDVRLSADGVAMVFHDRMLTRTSNAILLAAAFGLTSLAVHDWRMAQLRQLDAGSWFVETDPFGSIRHGLSDRSHLLTLIPQRIPTLRRVLLWAAACQMPLNIELKDLGTDRNNEQLAGQVVREIALMNMEDLVLLSSFNYLTLRVCRWFNPRIATAALQEGMHPPDLIATLRSLGVVAYHPADGLVDRTLVGMLRNAGLHVNVFTVNDPSRQKQLFDYGVNGIFTDYLNCTS